MNLETLKQQKEQLSNKLCSGIKGEEYKQCLAELNQVKAQIKISEALLTNSGKPILSMLQTSIDPLLEEITHLQEESKQLTEASDLINTRISAFGYRTIKAQEDLSILQLAIQIAIEKSEELALPLSEEERIELEKWKLQVKTFGEKEARKKYKQFGMTIPKGV